MSRPRTQRHLLVENAIPLNVKVFTNHLGMAEEASVRICFQRSGGPMVEQTIALISLPRVPFGGRRWYFICPETGARSCKLYLPAHGRRFLSREAYGLRYRVEHGTAEDNDIEAYFKLYKRITGHHPLNGSLSPIPQRPKWMHCQNYNIMIRRLLVVQGRVLDRLSAQLTAVSRVPV